MRSIIRRTVEVLYDRGEKHKDRWLSSSGFLVGGRSVLTAAHGMDWGTSSGTVSVRTVEGQEHEAQISVIGSQEDFFDAAVLEIIDPDFHEDLPWMGYVRVSRDDPHPVTGCWAVGFPRFQAASGKQGSSPNPSRLRGGLQRQTSQVWGYILPGTKLREPGGIELTTTTWPAVTEPGRSAWQGMSGSAVLVTGEDGGSRIIGVIMEHNVPAGAGTLGVAQISDVLSRHDADLWLPELGPTFLDGMGTVAPTHQPGLPDVFRELVAESATQAARWVDQWPVPSHENDAGRSTATDARTALSEDLVHRASEVLAAPPGDRQQKDALDAVLRSPQLAMIVDQLVAGHLLGQHADVAENRMRQAFVRLCAVHGVQGDRLSDGSAFDALSATCRYVLRNLGTSDRLVTQYWQRRVLYSMDTIAEQLASLANHLTSAPDPTSVVAFLDRLRKLVRAENSRISLALLGQNKSFPIDELYVEPSLTPDVPFRGFAAVEVPADQRFRSSWPASVTLGISQLERRSVVLGQPGVGKSTLTTKLAFDGTAPDTIRTPLAFVVTLRKLLSERERQPVSILDYIVQLCRTDLQMADSSTDLLRYLILGGDLHIIFDGLDEVTDVASFEWATKAIQSFCLEYKAARVTVTSREQGFDRGRFPDFAFYTLSPFDTGQVARYVQRWFSLDEGLSSVERDRYVADFVEQSTAASDLRRIPLMLALMCSIYAVEGNIPSRRSEIYETCSTLYFRDWDIRRKIRTSDVISALPPEVMFEAFSSLAATILSDTVMSGSGVTDLQLRRLLHEFFERKKILQAGEEEHVSSAFVDFITGRAWLLEKSGRNEASEVLYQFTHRTFLEYYAAAHYSRTMDTPQSLAELALATLVKDSQFVVAELAFQIRARHRPVDVDFAARHLVNGAAVMSLHRQVEAVRFLTSLLDAIAFDRDTVQVIVRFSIRCLVGVAEVGLQTWPANGYADHEAAGWFEYRSLAQAWGFPYVDELGEMLARLLRSKTMSRSVLVNAVQASLDEVVLDRPRIGGLLACALAEVLSEGIAGPVVPRASEEFQQWRSVERQVWEKSRFVLDAQAKIDPSLACFAALCRCVSVRSVIEWHGHGALYRAPLNVFCESNWNLAQILVQNVVRAVPDGEQPAGAFERPSAGDREALQDVFAYAAGNPDLRPDFVMWPDREALTRLNGAECSPNPRVRASDEAGALLLIMVDQALDARADLSQMHLGPHLQQFQGFLNLWKGSNSDDELRVTIEMLLPERHVAVLLQQASWLRAVDPEQLPKPEHTVSPAGNLETLLYTVGSGIPQHLGSASGDADDPQAVARGRVDLLRRLSTINPEGHRRELTSALRSLHDLLLARGHVDDAVAVAEERLAVARTSPAAVDSVDVDAALADLACVLATVDRTENASGHALELAERIRARGPRPESSRGFGSKVAEDPTSQMATVAQALFEVGDWMRGDAVALQRIELLRDLVTPDEHPYHGLRFSLAQAIDHRTRLLAMAGRSNYALDSARDGLAMFRQLLVARDDNAQRRNVVLMLERLAERLDESGDKEERIAVLRERIEMMTLCNEADSDQFWHGMAAHELATALVAAGRHTEALDAARNAAELFRVEPTEPDPTRQRNYGIMLGNLANRLMKARSTEEAVEVARRRLELFRALHDRDAETYVVDVADAMSALVVQLTRARRRREAWRTATEMTEFRLENGLTVLGNPRLRTD